MICKVCLRDDLTSEDFYVSNRSSCKVCLAERNRKWLEKPENKAKFKGYVKSYYLKNKSKRKAYYKAWRKDNLLYKKSCVLYSRKWRLENPDKRRAHRKVRSAIDGGVLERPSVCSSCGSPRFIQAHHNDYTKPLSVIWLCAVCHKKQHLLGKY